MATYDDYKENYERLIDTMEIKQGWDSRITRIAQRILNNKDKYVEVSDNLARTGSRVPWQVIGVIHYMEANLDFTTHLHNGDSLKRRTVQVPRGRPHSGEPPFTWVESAEDALTYDGLTNVSEWPMSRVAYQFEKFNGFGYHKPSININSPYLWSGTNHYSRGKYVSDGHYSPSAVSEQAGAMPIIIKLLEMTKFTAQEVIRGSKKLTYVKRMKAAVAGTFGTYFTADMFGAIPEQVKRFEGLGIPKEALVGGILILIIWIGSEIYERMSVTDYKEGRYLPSGLVDTKNPTSETIL